MSKFTGRRNYGWVSSDTEAEHYAQLSEAANTILKELDGYIETKSQVTTVTAEYTIVLSDVFILCNGTFTVYLPQASTASGQKFYIKNIGTGIITVDGYNTETIDDATTATLESKYEAINVYSNGSEWFIV